MTDTYTLEKVPAIIYMPKNMTIFYYFIKVTNGMQFPN